MSEISHSDFNIFKAKAISRGKLLERFRCHLQEIVDEMDMWKWDRIIKERPEVDPYAECRALRQKSESLIAALQECEEYFDNRADADCEQDGYIPNEEMKLLTLVREVLGKAGQ